MKALQVMIAILLAAVLGVQVFQLSNKSGGAAGEDPEKIKKYALELQESVPRKALEEYERYAKAAPLSDEDAANLYLVMGNLAMERLSDYETALGYFLRVKSLYPKSAAAGKVGRKIVTCLENTGQSFEAERRLAAETALTPGDQPKEKAEDILAEVGDQPITRRAVEAYLQMLPPDQRSNAQNSKQGRRGLLEGLIARELFFRMAQRKGYDKDPGYLAWLDNAKKTYLGKRIWEEEVTNKVQVTDSEFYSFYQQHPDKFREPAQYTKVGVIVCNNEAEARKARERLDKGEDFAAVAAEANRDDSLRSAKGILSPFYENQEALTFSRDIKLSPLLAGMKVGDLAGPVAIEDGSGVIKLFDKKEARQVPFDEAKASRIDDYKNVLELNRKERLMEELQKTDKVVIHEERL